MNDVPNTSLLTNKALQQHLRLATPVRITEQAWPKGTVPFVSIVCVTYNHGKFIKECLEGFLRQKTTFPVEIVIHDDASSDGTADIVYEYKSTYPQLIKPIFQKSNQYSKGNKASEFLAPTLKGKYIAVCEGDDYWTDPNKLEIQAGYLEEHPDCVISGHDAFIIDEKGDRISESKLPDVHKRDYGAEDLLYGRAWILTMSRVYRNILPREEIPERRYIKNSDVFTMSLLGQSGGSKYHSEIAPACYRIHAGGVWSMKSDAVKRDEYINSMFWIYRYYQRVGKQDFANVWYRQWSRTALVQIGARELLYEFLRRMAVASGVRWVIHGFLGANGTKRLKRLLGFS